MTWVFDKHLYIASIYPSIYLSIFYVQGGVANKYQRRSNCMAWVFDKHLYIGSEDLEMFEHNKAGIVDNYLGIFPH